MSESLDYSQDPEKIWKASLLKHQNEAYFALFFNSDFPKTWELLRGWIGSLGKSSQTALNTIVKELEDAIFAKRHIKPIRTYEIYDTISMHVFEFYLTQSGFGVVQTSSLKATQQAPTDKIGRREKATL